MVSKKELNEIKTRFLRITPKLNEKTRRLWAAAEANELGRGGITAVSKATGIAISTIRIGQRELKKNFAAISADETKKIRKKGGGRKSLIQNNSDLVKSLDTLIKPLSNDFSISPLRWTCKSTRRLVGELSEQGYSISHTRLNQLLSYLGYSVRSGQHGLTKGKGISDKNAQFKFINKKVIESNKIAKPVIYVDVRNRELSGDFSDDNKEKQEGGKCEKQESCGFSEFQEKNKVPAGIFGTSLGQDWVDIELDHGTVHFAASIIYQWWLQMGKTVYPGTKELLIISDIVTGKDAVDTLWKNMLQELADKIKLDLTVCYFPQGTYKWNKPSHNIFSHFVRNRPESPFLGMLRNHCTPDRKYYDR